MTTLAAALLVRKHGISSVPVASDGTKRATIKWEKYQHELPTEDDLKKHFANGALFAVVGGKVSGCLETIDFDIPGKHDLTELGIPPHYAPFCDAVREYGYGELLDKLLIAKTPSGGYHLTYRCRDGVEGNKKLARTKHNGHVEVTIETRGEGGYFLTAPSPGYEVLQGQWSRVPEITGEERDFLFSVARSLSDAPKETFSPERGNLSIKRPGDAYNEHGDLRSVLLKHGWQQFGHAGGRETWTRPGKNPSQGASATLTQDGKCFYVFSSNAHPFDSDIAYTPFAAYCKLEHGGDFFHAAQALRKEDPQWKPPPKLRGGVDLTTLPKGDGRKWFTYDEVETDEIKWLIEPYLPLGIGYVLLYGESGIGKSTALLKMIAELSNGYAPCSASKAERCEPVKSIILSAEDSATYVVKPRLKAFGANMKMIMSPEEFNEDGTPNPMILDEYGADELGEQVRAFGAKLLIIDPLSAYFDGENMNDRVLARAWTRRITNIAIQEGCCPVIVHHVNKSSAMQGRHRAAGSQDFFDACRSALMAVQVGEDFALVHEKHNLTIQGESIGYAFSKEKGFMWTGASDITSESATAQLDEHIEPGKLKGCKGFVLEQLEHGPMRSDDLEKGCKDGGYSVRTYRRAKAELADQIRSWKETGVGGAWWTEMREVANVYRGGD